MATADEVTGNGPEVAETAVTHTLQLLEWICARDERVGKRHGRRRLRQWHELATQQATMTQGEVRSSVSLVHTKLVTKENAFSGEKDGQERWRTWSFMMRAYRAAHVTNLRYILSVLLGDKALGIGRTHPVRDGLRDGAGW